MKRLLCILILINSINAYCQEIKISGYEKLSGICNPDNVTARFSIFTYTPYSNKEIKKIEKELNSKIKSLKTYSSLSEERMINLVLNCKGEVLKSKIDTKKIQTDIKSEIENAFKTLRIWKEKKYNGEIDCSILITFKVENGVIRLK